MPCSVCEASRPASYKVVVHPSVHHIGDCLKLHRWLIALQTGMYAEAGRLVTTTLLTKYTVVVTSLAIICTSSLSHLSQEVPMCGHCHVVRFWVEGPQWVRPYIYTYISEASSELRHPSSQPPNRLRR